MIKSVMSSNGTLERTGYQRGRTEDILETLKVQDYSNEYILIDTTELKDYELMKLTRLVQDKTGRQLATALGISESYVSMLEKNTQPISSNLSYKLLELVNFSVPLE